MKIQAILHILFLLLRKRKISAAYLAAECEVSERSIYRYVEELIVSGVPIDIIRGRNGGICLPDTYRLPENFFTKEEYAAAYNALSAFYEQLHDDTVQSAMEKLTRRKKDDDRNLTISGNILVDSGTWGDAYDFSEKLRVIEDATDSCDCLEILYIDRKGTESRRTVEPHLLVFKQNIWYAYAWCRTRNDFRLFKIGRIRSARKTGETFVKRPFDRNALPLKFDFAHTELADVKFLILDREKALPDLEEWLGIDNVREDSKGNLTANATLPCDEILISKILGFGGSIRVLQPQKVADAVRNKAETIFSLYAKEKRSPSEPLQSL